MCNKLSAVPGETPAAYRANGSAGDSAAGSAGGSAGDNAPDLAGAGRTARSAREEKSGQRRNLSYPPAPEPLSVPVIDNHTHLDFRDGLVEVSVREALDAAEAVGVRGAVQVGCDLESSRFTVAALEVEPRLLGAVAIHPNDAPQLADQGMLEEALREIEELAAHPRVRAIGETGLDFFRTGAEGLRSQEYSFRRHIDMAKRLGLALQIHDRDAHEDVVRVLAEEGAPAKVVFHCFSGGAGLARICNERGWHMSFAGTMTFKNAAGLREALAIADPSLVMVETDSPFLTPHPYRGRPNASYMVPYTLRSMAEVLAKDLDQLCVEVVQNTEAVYGGWES